MSTEQTRRGLASRIGRAIVWPLSRFFDPRFRGLGAQIDAVHGDLATRGDDLVRRVDRMDEAQRGGQSETNSKLAELYEVMTADMDAATEAATVIGSALADLRTRLDERSFVGAPVTALHPETADLLNYATSHRGFAAQKGLWLNPPVVVEHVGGDVRVGAVNERIVEVPYVLRGIRDLEPGARVLDVGANESTLAFSLASLGYRVTALDLTPYPFEHPLLEAVSTPIQEWETDDRFDAAICLSTVEHIGLDVYGGAPKDDDADVAAVARLWELLTPGGRLLLTTPFATRAETRPTERVYDRAALDRLLEGWEVVDLTIAVEDSELVWRPADGDVPPSSRAVALVTARRP